MMEEDEETKILYHCRESRWCAWNDDDMWEQTHLSDRINILLYINQELP